MGRAAYSKLAPSPSAPESLINSTGYAVPAIQILRPDNEVTRVRRAPHPPGRGDLVENRPPYGAGHPDHAAAFEVFASERDER